MVTTAIGVLEEVINGNFEGIAIIEVPRGILHRKMFKLRMSYRYHIVNQARSCPDVYFQREGFDVVYFSDPASVKSPDKQNSYRLICKRKEEVEEYLKSGRRLLIFKAPDRKDAARGWPSAVSNFTWKATVKIVLTESFHSKTVKIFVLKDKLGRSGLITNFPV